MRPADLMGIPRVPGSRAKLALIAQIEAGIGKALHLQTRRKAIDLASDSPREPG